MPLRKYRISLDLEAPFLFPSEEVGGFGYDVVAHKTADGKALIPRTQVRGLILHGLKALDYVGHAEAAAIIGYFGGEGDDATQDRGQGAHLGKRGLVSASDLVSEAVVNAVLPPAPRVAIDEKTGAAKPGQLVAVEQCFAPGTRVTFTGTLHIYCEADISGAVQQALNYHSSIGKLKSIGFGAVLGATCEPIALQPLVSAGTASNSEQTVIWGFTLDRPYLVDADLVAANAYVGQPTIPGGVLKGLVAKHLKANGAPPETFEALSDTRFGFARPVGLWPAFAFSLAYDSHGETIFDLALRDTVPSGATIVAVADWKRDAPSDVLRSQYMASCGLLEPDLNLSFETRTHIEIHPDTQTNVDGKLYSTQAVVLPPQGFNATVDLPAGPAAEMILEALGSELAGLGRTDAVLEPNEISVATPHSGPSFEAELIVRLQTPAFLLADWDDLEPKQAYAKAWSHVLPGCELTAHFTAEKLIGGYLAGRFGPTPGAYQPMLRTEAGSVFCLNVSGCAGVDVTRLLRFGACAPTFKDGTPTTWQNCPYVTGNGYGEVAIHEEG